MCAKKCQENSEKSVGKWQEFDADKLRKNPDIAVENVILTPGSCLQHLHMGTARVELHVKTGMNNGCKNRKDDFYIFCNPRGKMGRSLWAVALTYPVVNNKQRRENLELAALASYKGGLVTT